jgi:hypothetical protein
MLSFVRCTGVWTAAPYFVLRQQPPRTDARPHVAGYKRLGKRRAALEPAVFRARADKVQEIYPVLLVHELDLAGMAGQRRNPTPACVSI